MKKKRLAAISLLGALLLVAPEAWAASTLVKLGSHPFFKPPLTSVEDLNYMVKKQSVDLMQGFELAGLPEFFDDFDQQYPEAKIEAIKVHKGETLKWMFYKRQGRGKTRVARDVTWAADEPFDAFRFHIDHAGQRYEIVVPWKCGNVALRNVGPIPPPPPPPKPDPPPPEPNKSPLCSCTVTPLEAKCKQEMVMDASSSSDEDGKVTVVMLRLEDPEGNVVWEQVLDKEPFVHKFPAPCKAGQYTLKTSVLDDKGAESTSEECVKTFTVITKKIGSPVLDAGLSRIIDPATFIALRVGYEYYLADGFSVIGLVGPYLKIEGDDGASALALDLLLTYRFTNGFFLGLGGGYWYSDEDDNQFDLIADLGLRVMGKPDETNMSIYAEARSAVDEFDDMWSEGRFGLGVRVNF